MIFVKKPKNHSVKIGVNAFVIARDTEEEAQAVLREIVAKANVQAVKSFGEATREAGAASKEGEGNWAKSTFEDLVQYNDGFRTNLIGTPEQIAGTYHRTEKVGVDLVLSGFLHFIEEVEYFGEKSCHSCVNWKRSKLNSNKKNKLSSFKL